MVETWRHMEALGQAMEAASRRSRYTGQPIDHLVWMIRKMILESPTDIAQVSSSR
jgi:hypothetical protein